MVCRISVPLIQLWKRALLIGRADHRAPTPQHDRDHAGSIDLCRTKSCRIHCRRAKEIVTDQGYILSEASISLNGNLLCRRTCPTWTFLYRAWRRLPLVDPPYHHDRFFFPAFSSAHRTHCCPLRGFSCSVLLEDGGTDCNAHLVMPICFSLRQKLSVRNQILT